jgi:anti-sigma factor RsiW
VIARPHHLADDRLFDCYVMTRGGDPLDPRTADHLADCPACAARYAELVRLMNTVRAEGEAEADAVFTPERLRAQRQLIAGRIEHVGRPARILSFPARVVRRTMSASASSHAPRWPAAAAAAGLFIGIAVGASYEYGSFTRAPRRFGTSAAAATRLTPVATRGTGSAEVAADDAVLNDIELALERPHTRELVAFDAFTPHVREIRDGR